ncbi:hypothetical protein [Eikenella sp. NML120348]|uniref:hypothetical protein n=1 Tax=Eikenella sp. NML120348 TaxID=1795831 RepID=UPI0012E701F8|nr:hypothetical protein [Eikenella sp. NML120348]
MLKTKRGTDYLIAKLTVYGYRSGNLPAIELNADLIAFDRRLCSRLMECNAGQSAAVWLEWALADSLNVGSCVVLLVRQRIW